MLSQRTRLLTDTIDDMLKNVCNIDIKASCDSGIKEELEANGDGENGFFSVPTGFFFVMLFESYFEKSQKIKLFWPEL